ncbi:MAG TPA: hypothetical protein VL285_22095 [Bryobacteraceae bacterium]|nr:hypothetical protein [Bryobacteraceae bacterium]
MDLAVLADQAVIQNDPDALAGLQSSLDVIRVARAGASQDILHHEAQHAAPPSPPKHYATHQMKSGR